MPEIAEIRVVAKALRSQILKKRIKKVNVLYSRIILNGSDEFMKKLQGREFTGLDTNGKWLIFELGDYSFLSHLRMEGKYFYVKHDEPIEKHTHVIFELDDGMDLRYNDVRKFGRMKLVKTGEIEENPSIKKLGYEPDDERLTVEYLLDKLKKDKRPIKSTLLDQTIINGLGNIYANEVLFASEVFPTREAYTITKDEAKKIIMNAKAIILKSVEVGGSTIRSYTSSLGVIGHYQDYLKVHGKEKAQCSKCGHEILKMKLDGRSAYYCDNCQK